MRRATIKPDVEDVRDLFPLTRRQAQRRQEVFRRRIEPSLDPAFGDGRLDGVIELFCLIRFQRRRMRLAILVDEDRDRHAPIALARDQPVRAPFDHALQAVAPNSRKEFGIFNRLQRILAQALAVWAGLVHRDEPLRRRAADHRRLGAPRMGIADRRDAARQKVPALGQQLDDFRVRLALLAPLLAGRADDVESLQRLGKVTVLISAIRADDVADIRGPATRRDPGIEVILTMRRGRVDKSCTGIVGDMVTCEQRHVVLEEGV